MLDHSLMDEYIALVMNNEREKQKHNSPSGLMVIFSLFSISVAQFIHGYVLMRLWTWLVEPTVPDIFHLTYAASVGICLIVHFLCGQVHVTENLTKQERKSYLTGLHLVSLIMSPAFFLAMGWIVHCLLIA